MPDPLELALVEKALKCGVMGCVEWVPEEADRLRSDRYLQGLTPESIQEEVIDWVKNRGGKVRQQVPRGCLSGRCEVCQPF